MVGANCPSVARFDVIIVTQKSPSTKTGTCIYLMCYACKLKLWRHSQVVRQRSAKPLSPGSNPGAAFKKEAKQCKGFR